MKKLKVLAVLLTLSMVTNVHAALQSAPKFPALIEKKTTEYFQKAREMEAEGGALGLNATFAENVVTGEYEETTNSNNIDSHLCKNTEWGAAAMLSASDYGAGNGKVTNNYNTSTLEYDESASTTGNITGIFGLNGGAANREWTAAGIVSQFTSYYGKYLMSAHPRYVDNYKDGSDSTDFTRYIPGDATFETKTFTSRSGGFPTSGGRKSIFYTWC